jgi:hypothetical protein
LKRFLKTVHLLPMKKISTFTNMMAFVSSKEKKKAENAYKKDSNCKKKRKVLIKPLMAMNI